MIHNKWPVVTNLGLKGSFSCQVIDWIDIKMTSDWIGSRWNQMISSMVLLCQADFYSYCLVLSWNNKQEKSGKINCFLYTYESIYQCQTINHNKSLIDTLTHLQMIVLCPSIHSSFSIAFFLAAVKDNMITSYLL